MDTLHETSRSLTCVRNRLYDSDLKPIQKYFFFVHISICDRIYCFGHVLIFMKNSRFLLTLEKTDKFPINFHWFIINESFNIPIDAKVPRKLRHQCSIDSKAIQSTYKSHVKYEMWYKKKRSLQTRQINVVDNVVDL